MITNNKSRDYRDDKMRRCDAMIGVLKKNDINLEKKGISINSQCTLTRVESLTDYNKWQH